MTAADLYPYFALTVTACAEALLRYATWHVWEW
jgi:hypothetical protein